MSLLQGYAKKVQSHNDLVQRIASNINRTKATTDTANRIAIQNNAGVLFSRDNNFLEKVHETYGVWMMMYKNSTEKSYEEYRLIEQFQGDFFTGVQNRTIDENYWNLMMSPSTRIPVIDHIKQMHGIAVPEHKTSMTFLERCQHFFNRGVCK